MQLFNQSKNDAYQQASNAAVQAGDQEQQALFGEAVNQGNFANTAQGQIYGENQGQAAFANQGIGQNFSQGAQAGSFANTSAGQIYGQNQGAGAFYNNAANQDFQTRLAASQFGNQAEQQGFQQDAYAQELPINELDALMSSGQVGMPSGVQYSPVQVAPTNVLGAYNLNQQAQQANYQAQLANSQSLLGGLFSLGSAALTLSDRRLKEGLRKIAERPDGIGVYLFRFKGRPGLHVGVMAQEVRAVRPDLVRTGPHGWLMVDYEGLAA
jgi:hypothetical protein